MGIIDGVNSVAVAGVEVALGGKALPGHYAMTMVTRLWDQTPGAAFKW